MVVFLQTKSPFSSTFPGNNIGLSGAYSFININNFIHQNKQIYNELKDEGILGVGVFIKFNFNENFRLKNWTRLQTAPTDSSIIHQALQIRMENAMNLFREFDKNDEVET